MVIAPARTGRDNSRRMAVSITDHANRGTCSIFIWGFRMFKIVEIKLMAPIIEDTPAKCREKMAKSTAGPLWAI